MKQVRVESNPPGGAAAVVEVDPDDLIENDRAAKLLGIRPATLVSWRSDKRGPMYLKIGRLVYYRRADIRAWLAAQIRDPKAA
jgi:predicted DNA-binding transcriptional regulator AlpA